MLTILKNMGDSIYHRGPDDDGYFIKSNNALGMRRLSIIDLKTGKQPIFNEDKSVVIVYNGEIYNFKEIKKQLIKNGHKFATNTDTEVIVHLYEEKGYECLNDLNGMFAFAIYDYNKSQLFIARDRFGIKPLYYYNHYGDFVFGSELKSLLLFPEIKKSINIDALNLYLTFEHVPAPYSIYENIYKLEQGHFLIIKNRTCKDQKYYNLSFKNKFKEKNPESYVEELDERIENAVKLRTISDVPLGSFLSGGIDSSLITSYLTRCSNKKVKTFNIGFHEKSFDESLYARQVSDFLGTEHYEKIFSTKELIDSLPSIIDKMDEPFADASLLPTFLLSQYTRENVTVSLSGDGGDEVFAGYPTYYARKIGKLFPKWMYYLLNPITKLLPVSDENISFDFKVKKFISGIPYSSDIRHQIWLGSFDIAQKKQLLNKDIFLKLDDNLKLISDYMKFCDTENNWERSLWLDMRFYLQDNMLVKVDRASMMNSLEVRVPFLDHNLVEFASRIPSRLKYKGKTSKYILKHLAKKYLPDNIINRPKKGFGIPIAKWIKQDLKDTFIETLSERKIESEGYFNRNYVNILLDDHFKNRKDNRKLLWTLFVFEKWLERN